jgi:signal transduction histidine kinase
LAASFSEPEGSACGEAETVAMAEIGRTAESSLRLVERVLAWAKARGDTFVPRLEPVDAAVLIKGEIEAIAGRAARKGVRFILDLQEDLTVRTDVEMTSLIFRNLLQNAVKFTSEGAVTVSSRRRNGAVDIDVADTGVGMDKETLGRLFNPTSRITTVGTDGERGSGFGLVLCAEFAARFGGALTVKSEQGTGSVFTLSIPR